MEKGHLSVQLESNDFRLHFILEQCINPDRVWRQELHRFGSNSISHLRYNFYCNWAKREKTTWHWKCNTQINIVCNKNILYHSYTLEAVNRDIWGSKIRVILYPPKSDVFKKENFYKRFTDVWSLGKIKRKLY